MAETLQSAEVAARSIISTRSVTPTRALELEKVLRQYRRFGLARRVLELCKDHPDLATNAEQRLVVAQKRALCTYKDPDLPADQKLDDALRILSDAEDLRTTKNQETLGLAGAIYKRKWELSAQERNLEVSLAYYYRGYGEGVAKDFGYTAINAAFVLDCLADLESVESQRTVLANAAGAQRRALATKIRTEMVAQLPSLVTEAGNE